MTEWRQRNDPRPAAPTRSAFVEQVMSRVASSPSPSVPRSLVTAARERSLRDVRASLAVAWHIALHSRVPGVVRVQALGLVAVIALSAGAVSVAASAAAYRIAAPLVADAITQDAPDRRSLPAATPVPVASPSVDAGPDLVPRPGADAEADDGDSGRQSVQPGPAGAPRDEAGDPDDDTLDEEREDPADVEDADEPDQHDEDPSDTDDGKDDAEDGGDADATDAPDPEDVSDEANEAGAGDPEDPSED